MSLTATIAGQVVSVASDSPNMADKINEQSDFQLMVIDPMGTASFAKNMPITIVDSIRGTLFSGYINNQPEASLLYPNPTRAWALDCRDQTWLASKRSSNKTYINHYAGTILVDQVQRYGAEEGLMVAAALRWDEEQAEWAGGTLSSTVAATNASSGNVGDGDVELMLAGSAVTHTETATSDFSTGTLSSVAASNNSLILSGRQGIAVSAQCTAQNGANNYLYYKIWDGAYTIVSGDELRYNLWISADSPEMKIALDGVCSTGDSIRNYNSSGVVDQNILQATPKTNLKGWADNQWYSRQVRLTVMAGKVLNTIHVGFEGDSVGTYTAYLHTIQIMNGNTVQATIYTGGALNTSAQVSNVGYSHFQISTPTVYDQVGYRNSSSVSIASVGIVTNSSMLYTVEAPAGTAIVVNSSFDGGATWQPTTSMQAIPNLPAGANTASMSVATQQILSITGNDPTLTPALTALSWTVNPAYSATKTDVLATYNSSANFNTGTYSNTQVLTSVTADMPIFLQDGASQAVVLNGAWRNWNTESLASQSVFGSGSPTQDAQQGQLVLGTTTVGNDVRSELVFAGQWQNFTASVDIQAPATTNEDVGIVYRTTFWGNANYTWAYCAQFYQQSVRLIRGTNTSPGSATTLATATNIDLQANSWHKLTVVVSGNVHQVYVDGVRYINYTDATFPATGYMAARGFNNDATSQHTYRFDNFGVVAALSGTWTTPGISLNSVGTVGSTLVQWNNAALPTGTSILAETSINGGSTWQTVTNGGAISGLSAGTSTSGVSLLVRFTLSSGDAATSPALNSVTILVVGAYSASGIWQSGPLGYDSFTKANLSSSWGVDAIGLAWVRAAGTDTPSVSSNKAVMTNAGSAAATCMLLGSGVATDCEGLVRITVGNTSDTTGIILRSDAAAANHYLGRLNTTNGLIISKRVAGTLSTLASFSSGITIAANSVVWLRFRAQGSTLSVKAWLDGSSEPGSFAGSTTDSAFASGQFGLSCGAQPASPEKFDSFSVTYYPDVLSLSGVGRATSSLVNWNAIVPTGTSLAVATSLDKGATWQSIASAGGAIPGITTLLHSTLALQKKPAAFYHLNDTGSSAADSSGNGQNGTLNGTITKSVAGALQGPGESTDTAMTFNGSTGYITLPNGLIAANHDLSLSLWVNVPSFAADGGGVQRRIFIDNIDGTNAFQLATQGSDTSFVWGVNDSTGQVISSRVGFSVNTWYHVVGTWVAATRSAQLYVNGIAQSNSGASSFGIGSIGTNIGRRTDGTGYFPGTVDEVLLFSSALSAADVLRFYNAGAGGASQTVDTFATNTSANYTQSNFGGTTGTWTWDTANLRLSGAAGNGGTLIYATALTPADNVVAADLDQCDGSGLIANYQSASSMYYIQAWDGSGTGTQNSLKLFRRSGGVSTQVGGTATIDWPRGRYRRFILDIQAGVLTVSMDGTTLITYTDGSPLAAGKSGLLLNTLLRCYSLRIQQYGPNVSALTAYTRLTLTSTDPTATPQVLDLQTFVGSPDIDPGALIAKGEYRRTYLDQNFGDLNTQSATTWWNIRADKSVAFRQRDAMPSPWILDSSNIGTYTGQPQGDILIQNLKLTTSGDLYRNRQILTNVTDTGIFSERRTGDGSTRTWNVSNPIVAPPTITLNGQAVTIGVKGVDTGKQFYYQLNSTTITQDSSQVILEKDIDTLAISYTGSFIIDVVRDNATAGTFAGTTSQQEMAAIDHTSGMVENIIDASSLGLNKAAAQAYGDQLLQQYGVTGARTLTFDTLRPSLAPGQQLTAYVPEEQCVKGQFLIVAVNMRASIAPTVPGGVLYWYSISATEGAALGSPWKLLSSLLNK